MRPEPALAEPDLLIPHVGVQNLPQRRNVLELVATVDGASVREPLVVVLQVHLDRDPDLAHVGGAPGQQRPPLRLQEDWEDDARQDGDDGDDDQQLHQREGAGGVASGCGGSRRSRHRVD